MELYKPTNSKEEKTFKERFCNKCVENWGDDCENEIMATLLSVYPPEWQWKDEEAVCTAFQAERL